MASKIIITAMVVGFLAYLFAAVVTRMAPAGKAPAWAPYVGVGGFAAAVGGLLTFVLVMIWAS